MSYFVYIVECADKTLYTGVATNVDRRIEEHNTSDKGAKYTRARRPVKLLGKSEYKNRSEAQKEESRIKKMTRDQKIQYIRLLFSPRKQ